MKRNDIIWGEEEVSDQDVITLLEHESFKRIDKIFISTFGYLFHYKRHSTRGEHSWGCYRLLKHFNVSKEEQVAGLLHDISHTVLSHASTYYFLKKFDGEEYHELIHKKFFKESGLWDLLTELGFDPERISNEDNFSLQENNLPDICADRIDYCLRDSLRLQILSHDQVMRIISDIEVIKNEKDKSEFVFSTKESALDYSEAFYILNLCFYGSASEAFFNHKFGELIGYAIKEGILDEVDWFSDDISIVNKLRKARIKNKKINQTFKYFETGSSIIEDQDNYDEEYSKKIRIVDPKVKTDQGIMRVTELDSGYNSLIKRYQNRNKQHSKFVRVFES